MVFDWLARATGAGGKPPHQAEQRDLFGRSTARIRELDPTCSRMVSELQSLSVDADEHGLPRAACMIELAAMMIDYEHANRCRRD